MRFTAYLTAQIRLDASGRPYLYELSVKSADYAGLTISRNGQMWSTMMAMHSGVSYHDAVMKLREYLLRYRPKLFQFVNW